MSNRNRRGMIVISTLMIVVVLFSYFFVIQTGVVHGLDLQIDEKVNADLAIEEDKKLKEGIIYDCNEYQITALENDEVTCLYPTAYSIIGYSSPVYGQSDIRNTYKDLLFQEDGKEAKLYMTTDTGLQQFCYDKLNGRKGSIVVLDNDSGEVKAMVSKSNAEIEYDVNKVEELYSEYSKINGMFMNQALCADTPGSVFKMITAISLYENGFDDYMFNDNGNYNGVVNAGKASYGYIGINDGLVYSVNTFFASSADKVGAKKLEETAHEFMIGDNVMLDIGYMQSNFDMEYYQNKRLIEDTGYGQGKTLISPIHMAMIISTISNEGKMYKPYIVSKVTVNDKAKYEAYPDILKDDYDSVSVTKTKEALHNVALHYGFDEETYGYICAKTGTAENDNGTPPHIYLVCSSKRYSVVISVDDTYDTSRSLVCDAQDIFRYLEDNGFNE